jgi:ankyrin repeat protein
LQAGAGVNAVDGTAEWPLWTAARNGDTARVKRLLEWGAGAHQVHIWGTALHAAARADDIESMKLLLAAGIDPNREDSYDCTAVQCAWSVEAAQLLLASGAKAVPPSPLQQLDPYMVDILPPMSGIGGPPSIRPNAVARRVRTMKSSSKRREHRQRQNRRKL